MYHITHSRSKTKPFNLVHVSGNGEPVSSHPLKTRASCFKNVAASLKGVKGINNETISKLYFLVQDDTRSNPFVFRVYADGTRMEDDEQKQEPKYIPGRNPKKKKK